jgi:hypothetical protein
MEAILWIAGLGVLAIFAMIPMSVHLMKAALHEDEEAEIEPRQVERREPRQGGAGS